MSKPKNDWQARFGAKRRAIDRAILAEAERTIEEPISFKVDARIDRDAIARAFGRPLDPLRH
jgi:hypothetical protein